QGYILAMVMLPDGSSLQRTDKVVAEVEAFILKQPYVSDTVLLGGMDFLSGGIQSSSAATMFVRLVPFGERHTPQGSANVLAGNIMKHFANNKEAFVLAVSPPPIRGLGQRAGFEMELQSRGGGTLTELSE